MIIDCDICVASGTDACDDCIVTALGIPIAAVTGDDASAQDRRSRGSAPRRILELADDERAAIDAMSSIGLIPGIRLVTRDDADDLTESVG